MSEGEFIINKEREKVCVCVREREKERNGRIFLRSNFFDSRLSASKDVIGDARQSDTSLKRL